MAEYYARHWTQNSMRKQRQGTGVKHIMVMIFTLPYACIQTPELSYSLIIAKHIDCKERKPFLSVLTCQTALCQGSGEEEAISTLCSQHQLVNSKVKRYSSCLGSISPSSPFRRSGYITSKTQVHPSASRHRRQLRQVLINRR